MSKYINAQTLILRQRLQENLTKYAMILWLLQKLHIHIIVLSDDILIECCCMYLTICVLFPPFSLSNCQIQLVYFHIFKNIIV